MRPIRTKWDVLYGLIGWFLVTGVLLQMFSMVLKFLFAALLILLGPRNL